MSTKTYPFWLGGVAASMAASCTHPLDLTKVRMQTYVKSHANAPKPSVLSVMRFAIEEAGIRSLYTGLTASLLRQMSYSLVRIGIYEDSKRRLRQRGQATDLKLLCSAGVAGAIGGVAGNPADILLVRMTTDTTRPLEQRYNYGNALRGLMVMVQNEGVKGLFRGVGPNTARAIIMNISQVGSYDYFKHTLLRQKIPGLDYQFKDNLLVHALASCMAGTVATTACAPFDVIKSRVMSESSKTGPMEIFVTSLKNEGPSFLFKGWTPAFIRLGPNTVLLFVFLEQIKKVYSLRW